MQTSQNRHLHLYGNIALFKVPESKYSTDKANETVIEIKFFTLGMRGHRFYIFNAAPIPVVIWNKWRYFKAGEIIGNIHIVLQCT